MKLEAAIAKSPIGAAERPAIRGGAIVAAMRIRGQISIVESVANPIIKLRVPTAFDFAAENWRPVKERVA